MCRNIAGKDYRLWCKRDGAGATMKIWNGSRRWKTCSKEAQGNQTHQLKTVESAETLGLSVAHVALPPRLQRAPTTMRRHRGPELGADFSSRVDRGNRSAHSCACRHTSFMEFSPQCDQQHGEAFRDAAFIARPGIHPIAAAFNCESRNSQAAPQIRRWSAAR
jgi:hypothetical protein